MSKSLLRRPIVRVSALVTLAMFVAVATILWSRIDSVQNPLESDRWFTQWQLGLTSHLYDVGVVDVNSDSWLDLFTVNHFSRQSLLVNDTSGEFTDRLLQLGLSQDSEFPGAEQSDIDPPIETPGLYIYWHQAELVMRTHDLGDIDSVTGEIQLARWVEPESVVVQTKGNFNVTTHKSENKLTIKFAAQGNGQLIISSLKYIIVESSFKLNEQLPLERVYVGPEKIRPSSHEFRFYPGKDRHGMAWADFQGDEQLDVFIVRGGSRGKMRLNSPEDKDELLIQDSSVFKDQTAASGILKKTCPARQVASVDFDNDGKLDFYVVCGRGRPNQLHWQRTEGRFIDVALERGLDIPEPGLFVWLDAENDGDMDLLWASDNKEFWLYVNHSGRFEPQSIGQSQGRVSQLTISDYDSDGDLDVFAASLGGNVLLTNVNGIYEITDPQSVGLTAQSSAANWADYDNDGLMDLHVLPDGIYRQRSDRRFEATQLLKSRSSNFNVFCTWFDADNDGSRDLLIGMEDRPLEWIPPKLMRMWKRLFPSDDKIKRLRKSRLMLYRNVGAKNHWLQLQLIGKKGNRQAIGARVEVATPDGVQLQQVGQAEGSINSQGHYRLYFGLGKYNSADSVRIIWPDGTLTEIENLEGDRLFIAKQVS